MHSWKIISQSDGSFLPYTWLEGQATPALLDNFRSWIMPFPNITWQHAEFGPPRTDFARFHFDTNGAPVQVELRGKTGKFGVLAPSHSDVNERIQSAPEGQVRIVRKATVSALAASVLVTSFNPAEEMAIRRAAVAGPYTDEDRTFLAEHAYIPSLFHYLGAHLPPHWRPQPPGSENSSEYRRAFRELAILFPFSTSTIGVAPRLHHFMQMKSDWPGANQDVMGARLPDMPDNTRISENMSWDDICFAGEDVFFSEAEQDIIREKVKGELITPEVEIELCERRLDSESQLHKWIISRVDQEAFSRLSGLLRAHDASPENALRRYVTEYLMHMRRSTQSAAPCEFCGEACDRFSPGQDLARVLRGQALRICSTCIYAIVRPKIGAIEPYHDAQQWVHTRAELVELIRTMAEQLGVIPGSDPISFLAQVPVGKLQVALTLLRRLPAPERRKQLAPEGWISLLADAELLAFESGKGYGLRCVAEDGHPCLSLGEKFIDDWLHRHNIAHEREPRYPLDLVLNPHSMRGDFWARDTFIEYFGLMSNPTYRDKVQTKRRLAEKHGIRLVELYPEDISDAGLNRKLGTLLA